MPYTTGSPSWESLREPLVTYILAHIKHKLFHGVWDILLDDDFLNGHRKGWVISCADRVIRRVFPHIFTYSADYPEKYVTHTLQI